MIGVRPRITSLRVVRRLVRTFAIAWIGFDHSPKAARREGPENQEWDSTDETDEAEDDKNERE